MADGSRDREDELVEGILSALRGLRYGSVEIVVHEARVVQITRTEKVRYTNDLSAGGSRNGR
ncbi:MAG: YezD family protein [Polyangiales bacterium]